jgi:reverse transcriptase-like protein
VEDQIVLQALANFLADKVRSRRRKVEAKLVFSNFLETDGNGIFFLQSWHKGYTGYLEKINDFYVKGYRWVAQFDLAAFYDTISHELLFKTAFPNTEQSAHQDTVCKWLQTWATPRQTWPLGHGIPQGPVATDFLAEVFLLPVDEFMGPKFRYLRYVDDIRLFGKTEFEVQTAVRDLEMLSRDRGIIPQGKKFAITQVTSVREAIGMLPSIRPTGEGIDLALAFSPKSALKHFQYAIKGRPRRINDKSRARFVLFRATPSTRLRNLVLNLLPKHPEHIDAFVHYLRQFRRSEKLVEACVGCIKATPYTYVRGELLAMLAPIMKPQDFRPVREYAISIAKDKNAGIAAKWGALAFLCRAERLGLGRYSRFALHQHPGVQALVISHLPKHVLFSPESVAQFLKRKSMEPGLAFADQVIIHRQSLANLGVTVEEIPTQVSNVLRELGVIPGKPIGVDPMGEILYRRYNVSKQSFWRVLFANEYLHGLQQLTQAEKLFYMGRSQWLNYQNSFNNTLFLALQAHLNKLGHAGACKTRDKNGKLIKFGSMLAVPHPFPVAYPVIADGLKRTNDRRNKLDSSHPYDEKTGTRNNPLSKREQSDLVNALSRSYVAIHGLKLGS